MKKSIEDVNITGKRVIVRCDFNVPMDDEKNITDDKRIESAIPTIQYLVNHDAKVILMSHLGRPKCQADEKYSLKPVAKRLSELLNKEVTFIDEDNIVNEKTKEIVNELQNGDVALLQNVRFKKEEKKNDMEFAKELASLADLYVNDAFGTAHRAHASTTGIAEFLPAVSGYLIKKEISLLEEALQNPERPFTAILGGSKVSDKIGVIKNLLNKVDNLIIGGGMVFTFLKAQGYEVGQSLLEKDKIDLAKTLLEEAKIKNVNILLPIDIVVAKEFKNDTEHECVSISNIPKDKMGLDIGKKSVEIFREEILKSKMIIWNGPMGVFEMPNFAAGTEGVAKALADSSAITIIGGGDSAAAVEQFGYADKMTHMSTGGGASLKLLEGNELIGIKVLQDI